MAAPLTGKETLGETSDSLSAEWGQPSCLCPWSLLSTCSSEPLAGPSLLQKSWQDTGYSPGALEP